MIGLRSKMLNLLANIICILIASYFLRLRFAALINVFTALEMTIPLALSNIFTNLTLFEECLLTKEMILAESSNILIAMSIR